MRFVFLTLSAALTAAHFFRVGNIGAAAACLAVIALPFLKRSWMVPVIQGAMLLFFLIAVETLSTLVRVRQMTGAPWIRLTVIMGSVALLHSAGFAWYFRSKVRERFTLGPAATVPSAVAFFLTATLLTVVQIKARPGRVHAGGMCLYLVGCRQGASRFCSR